MTWFKCLLALPRLWATLWSRLDGISSAIAELAEALRALREQVSRCLPPSRRLAVVYGSALSLRREDEKVERINLVAEPQWATEGETVTVTFRPMYPIRELELKTCEPFLMTGVFVGTQYEACSLGAAPVWHVPGPVHVGNDVTVHVLWKG